MSLICAEDSTRNVLPYSCFQDFFQSLSLGSFSYVECMWLPEKPPPCPHPLSRTTQAFRLLIWTDSSVPISLSREDRAVSTASREAQPGNEKRGFPQQFYVSFSVSRDPIHCHCDYAAEDQHRFRTSSAYPPAVSVSWYLRQINRQIPLCLHMKLQMFFFPFFLDSAWKKVKSFTSLIKNTSGVVIIGIESVVTLLLEVVVEDYSLNSFQTSNVLCNSAERGYNPPRGRSRLLDQLTTHIVKLKSLLADIFVRSCSTFFV